MSIFVRPTHIFITYVDGNGNLNNYTCKYDGLSEDGKIQLNGHNWNKHVPELSKANNWFPVSITPLFDIEDIPHDNIHPSLITNSVLVTAFISYKEKTTGIIRYLKTSMNMNVRKNNKDTYMQVRDIYDIRREVQKFVCDTLNEHIEFDNVLIMSIIPTNENFPSTMFPKRIN